MTIEEAIDQLQDLKKDRESFICSDTEPDNPFRYDIESIDVALKYMDDLMKENAKLKRLIKLAMKDIRSSGDFAKFCFYRYESVACGKCEKDCEFWKWKHADEAKGLIDSEMH